MDLRFSKSGNPGIEKAYRTHYVSPALSKRKRAKLQERLDRDPKPVVFEIVHDPSAANVAPSSFRIVSSTWRPANHSAFPVQV